MITRVLYLLGLAASDPAIVTEDLEPEARAKGLDLEARLEKTPRDEDYTLALAKLYREPVLAQYVMLLERALDVASADRPDVSPADLDLAMEAERKTFSEALALAEQHQIDANARAGEAEGKLADALARIANLEREAKYGRP